MTEQTQSFPGAFCEPCNKWRKPSALMPDGSCPRCRTPLEVPAEPDRVDAGDTEASDAEQAAVKIPWHFWVMVAATVLYLGWRIIQGIQSLF